MEPFDRERRHLKSVSSVDFAMCNPSAKAANKFLPRQTDGGEDSPVRLVYPIR